MRALPKKGRLLPPLRAKSPRPRGQRPVLSPREETRKKRQGPRLQSHPLPRAQRVAPHLPVLRMSSWAGAGG
ncbi:rCG63009 [Rattus norvegicus]|uniref:RCG63009 n=1 Tax=Rattus norvegicus TaxID=10116 RepID=A6ISJ3_RAT|nr:rCG63009 [Rattus norvegicus]